MLYDLLLRGGRVIDPAQNIDGIHDVAIKDARTRREILVLCRCIDEMRKRRHDRAMEVLCRRLAGLHTADVTGNWKMCAPLGRAS